MAVLSTKCPNCGATMTLINDQLVCPKCRTSLLQIADAKIDGDVTIMGADEFVKKLEASKRQFIININDKLQIGDVETMVINKKIKDAQSYLDIGEYYEAQKTLYGISDKILSAERVRFLADMQVTTETQLMLYDGKIDDNTHFKNIISLADDQTRNTYLKLAELCNVRIKIKNEVLKVEELWKVNLRQEAVAYAKAMCQRYPQSYISWATLFSIKQRIEPSYVGDLEYQRIRVCPDFTGSYPEVMQKRFDDCGAKVAEYTKNKGFHGSVVGGIILGVALCFLIGVMTLYYGGVITYIGYDFLFYIIVPVISLAIFGLFFFNLIFAVQYGSKKATERKGCLAALNSIPKAVHKVYVGKINNEKGRDIFLKVKGLIVIICTIVTVVVACFVPGPLISPEVDGIEYGPGGFLGGYKVVEIKSQDDVVVVADRIFLFDVMGVSMFQKNHTVKEIVLPYEVAKGTIFLSDFEVLESVFIMGSRPSPDDEDYISWRSCLNQNYYCDATIYWEGEWEMRDGRPVKLVNK